MYGTPAPKYEVTLMDQEGQTVIYPVATRWNTAKDFVTLDSIGVAAAAQATAETHSQRKFVPVSVVPQDVPAT